MTSVPSRQELPLTGPRTAFPLLALVASAAEAFDPCALDLGEATPHEVAAVVCTAIKAATTAGSIANIDLEALALRVAAPYLATDTLQDAGELDVLNAGYLLVGTALGEGYGDVTCPEFGAILG